MEALATTRRIASYTALSAIGFGAIAGCGTAGPEFDSNRPGTVVGHRYEPPDTTFIMAGKAPIIFNNPEEFYLTVRQCDQEVAPAIEADGCVTEEVEVTKKVWKQHPVGSEITLSED